MDLGLNEVQQMLKSSAQEFLSRECPLTLVRAMEEDPRGYTDQLWGQMVGLGLDRLGSFLSGTGALGATSLT